MSKASIYDLSTSIISSETCEGGVEDEFGEVGPQDYLQERFGLTAEHIVEKVKAVTGKPILFGTTEEFLRSFGVSSLEELPELTTVQIEEFRAQAEQEASSVSVDI